MGKHLFNIQIWYNIEEVIIVKKIDFTKYSSIEIYQMVLNRDIIKFPKGFWNKDRSIEISKYLFENILKWDKKDIEIPNSELNNKSSVKQSLIIEHMRLLEFNKCQNDYIQKGSII